MKILVEIIVIAVLFYVFLPLLVSAVNDSNYVVYILLVVAWIASFFIVGWLFDKFFKNNNNGQ